MAEAIIPRAQSDELNDAQVRLGRARALVDVLSEMCAPGGDLEVGSMALEQLRPDSLGTTLSILDDILIEADGFVHAAFASRSKAKDISHA